MKKQTSKPTGKPSATDRMTYGRVFYCRTELPNPLSDKPEERVSREQYRGVIRDGASGKILWETASWGQADRLLFDKALAYDGMREKAATMGFPVELHHPLTKEVEVVGA